MQPRSLGPGIATMFNHTDDTSPLRVYGLPKHMLLEFRILGTPCSVTTSTTLSLIRALEESKETPARLVLNGRAGCGKSYLLLQAAEYAAESGEWIVLYIPRTRRFVDGSTPYSYSLATRTYLQPRAARETLQRLGTVNEHILEYIFTNHPIELAPDLTFEPGSSILDVIDAASEEEAYAVVALEAVMRELGEQDSFPVLIAIDEFQTLAGRTLYRDPRFHMIRPHHLSMPRLLLEYASGRKTLSRGLVLGALNRSDTQFPISAQLAEALRLPAEFAPSPRSVRERRSAQLAMYLENPAPPPPERESELEFVPEEEYEKDAEAEELDADAAEVEGVEGETAAAEPLPEKANELEQEEDEQEKGEKEEMEQEEDEDEDEDSAENAEEIPWTGWRVYDPPTYEDSVVATAAQPFPVPPPAEVWRQMVLREDQEPEAAEEEEDLNAEEEDLNAEDGEQVKVASGTRSRMKRKRGPQGGELALRAIRVPDALTVREAAALFEVWLDAGVLRTGGQRRAARRAELGMLEDWRDVKDEADESDSDSDYDSDLEDTTQVQGGEYDEVRALEQAVEMDDEIEDDIEEDYEFDSFDAEHADEMEDRVHEFGEELEKGEEVWEGGEAEAVWEGEEGEEVWEEGEEVWEEGPEKGELLEEDGQLLTDDMPVEHVASSGEMSDKYVALSADGAGVSSRNVALSGMSDEYATLSADDAALATEDEERDSEEYDSEEYDSDADGTDADSDSDAELNENLDAELDRPALDLDFGDDAEIARTLSHGLRGALEDPSIAEELLENPLVPDAPVSTDSGADDLFLGKYTESSGNPRAFVAGLLSTLQS
ncbi:mitochondrial ribosomal death-associated protein 3-domain-containing protein [Mycena rosella]|uniref:Small ribosomal subunit protein mS29 n=1 Tax=Mycena rosella TaxID=1033263 RepID=A0AAD7E0T1_MYCRO|nr:mitochondrial ribosomal death-associated protein 3-domain-containing protein [Mycena rosella]